MSAPTYIVVVEGLDEVIAAQGGMTKAIERDARRAVNKTVRDGRTLASRAIQAQVNFTASYLGPNSGRLDAIPAGAGSLEGRIRARTRPTSLARFTKDKPLVPGQRRRKQGIKVSVKPGHATYLRNAFIVPLRSGTSELGNLGLAIRSDTKPPSAYKPKQLGKNLWLLYGPSVSQILYSARNARGSGVAEEIAPELADKLEAEFVRLRNLDHA